ncbi:Vps16, N-terminal region-domain-containing protein [Sphaerosporella brunnea]|uniref:Probable vacuolar protein sorting-associated protein 16 homolog n=1 Tax=Sphaerosporella brunnea TaxID=1250544 RepID=A0A5J5FC23_9PEZI|nr:Vps16, N-terminal region-domain-containing protein [Sphaerosporella brunnea]
MPPSSATTDWEVLEDKYYRKILLYCELFSEDHDLNNYVIAGAPYSGAIALYRNEDQLQELRGGAQSKPSIDIYSSSGRLIRKISYDKGNAIRGLGWSEDEKLLVIAEDGTVRCYSDLQGEFTQFSLGHGAEIVRVKEVRFWSTGFVALLRSNRLVAVSRYDEPRPRFLADPSPYIADDIIHSWALIPPAYTLSRHVEVLLSTGQTILVVDPTDAQDQDLQSGPFTHISVSPNGRYVALYTTEGRLWVIKADFQDKLSEYDSGMGSVIMPRTVEWCGNDSVVIAWDDEVHMVGPKGEALKYYYDSRVHLIPDIDGVRLLTAEKCELLQKVPDVTEEIFKIGATSPASILLDAVDQLEKKSPKADDNIMLIRMQLAEAVDACIKAAGHEFSVHWQKQLLKAASFGKSVPALYSSDDFVDMCETLRVLNAARFYEVGMPITYEQFIRLTPEKLIQRLVNRQQHLLALRVSEHLRLPTDRIYIHWACMKVRQSSDDEDSICRMVVSKLMGKRGISFEEIARTAYEEGRGRLATQLLNYEPQAGRQVPLLLNMEEDEIALDKAIESGDTDLVFFVLLHLKKKHPLANFFRIINDRPFAAALVESSARETDLELLKDFYYQDDRRADGAHVILRESLEAKDLQLKQEKLKVAQKLLSDSKDHALEAKALEESSKLLHMQESFEREVQERFMGISVNETIFRLISKGYSSRAVKVKNEFKVPEKRYWWLRLRALVERRDWNEIEEWTKTKKSPIGWEPFFNEVLSAGNTKVAATFVAKCTNVQYQERIDMYMRCGLIMRAADEANRAKDVAALETLRGKAMGRDQVEIERLIKILKGGK